MLVQSIEAMRVDVDDVPKQTRKVSMKLHAVLPLAWRERRSARRAERRRNAPVGDRALPSVTGARLMIPALSTVDHTWITQLSNVDMKRL